MTRFQVRTSACLLLSLAACQDEHAALPTTTPTAATPPVVATEPPGTSGQASNSATGMLFLQPSRLETCDSPAELEIKWDVATKRSDVKWVELWVAKSVSDNDKLFAASLPAFGRMKTGPWMRPGSVVILKTQGSAEVLQRSIVGGPECN